MSEKTKKIKTKKVKKVMTTAGWIPVDDGSMHLCEVLLIDDSGGSGDHGQITIFDGYTFESEGETITGRVSDIKAIK